MDLFNLKSAISQGVRSHSVIRYLIQVEDHRIMTVDSRRSATVFRSCCKTDLPTLVNQWRSQECELGAAPPLHHPSPLLPVFSPLPLLTGLLGYNPGIFLKLKVLVGEF